MCGVRIEVADGRITSIKGDAEDPFSRGHICPKAVALRDLHEAPARRREGLCRERRTAGRAPRGGAARGPVRGAAACGAQEAGGTPPA